MMILLTLWSFCHQNVTARQMTLGFELVLSDILFIGDVIVVKNGTGCVACALHGHLFRYPGPCHIAHGGASKVVKNPGLWEPSLGPCRAPRLSKALHRPDFPMLYPIEHQGVSGRSRHGDT